MKWETKYLPFLFGIIRKNYYLCNVKQKTYGRKEIQYW